MERWISGLLGYRTCRSRSERFLALVTGLSWSGREYHWLDIQPAAGVLTVLSIGDCCGPQGRLGPQLEQHQLLAQPITKEVQIVTENDSRYRRPKPDYAKFLRENKMAKK
ncbi:hypothetical protein AVEN_205775-1 [Araneus ventricosus]|uniref:Uncharacterized protein n=1 Tax=Araneus ventricosus TaxID=182803 RepID=A0A4Y2IXH8_ARAVE|nr:hypothetical protein AVEN_205775-1 [Araneus ventricosus]